MEYIQSPLGFPPASLEALATHPQFLKDNFQWSQPPKFWAVLNIFASICILIRYLIIFTNLANKHNNDTIHSRYTTTD